MIEQVVKLSGLHKAMSRQMVASWTEVPQFHLETEVDCSELIELRKRVAYRPSYTAIIAKAAAETLVQHPALNASWRADHIVEFQEINIGIAVDTRRGLMVPVIRDVASKSLEEVESELKKIKLKAEKGNYMIEELTDGTFTISNLGMYRVNAFNSIVNAPQAAILAIPRMYSSLCLQPDGQIGTKMIMRPLLSVDHRVTDGATGAKFVTDFAKLLENPGLIR